MIRPKAAAALLVLLTCAAWALGSYAQVPPPKLELTEEQEAELAAFLSDHSGEFTYAQIAERFAGGQFTARQVQGKVLSMERTADVAPTPKAPVDKKYTEEQEDTYVAMANAGAALEDIAAQLNKPLNSVRGKGLSLYRAGLIESIPKQKTHVEKKPDALEALGDISEFTVAEIAEKIKKSERGVRQMITYRGLECKDYKAKPRKNQEAA